MFQRLNASNLKNATILNHLLDVGIYRNAIDTGTSLDRVFGGVYNDIQSAVISVGDLCHSFMIARAIIIAIPRMILLGERRCGPRHTSGSPNPTESDRRPEPRPKQALIGD